jgi:hypothetical protein
MGDMWKPAAILGLAAAMALSAATPAAAAPVLTNTTAVKAAVTDDATQVRWRGRGWRGHGPAVVGGLAAGALIGGAIATSPYHHGYYAYDPYPGAYAYAGPTYYYGSPELTLPRRYFDRDCISGYDSAGVGC